MTDLFLRLVDMSISASWVVLAVLAARLVLKKAPKAMRCALWALVAVRLVCPFSLESTLSLIPEADPLPEEVQTIQQSPEPGDIVAVYSNPSYIGENGLSEPGEAHIYMALPASDGSVKVAGPLPLWENLGFWISTASFLWLGGMLLMLAYAVFSYLQIARKVAASIDIGNSVYICDYIDSPFILGIIKPKIYLPSAMEPGDAAHVLAHERTHLKRKDHWWKPLGFALLAVYWFHPLLWVAYILLCQDIELACDERVVKTMDAPEKKAYSEALLNCSVPRHLIAACPLAFGEVGVKQRVKSVLNYKKPGFWILLVSVIAIIVVAVCFLTDPEKDTLSDFYSGDRESVTCVDLMNHKGAVCLCSPSERTAVWELLERVEYDPQPHTTETEWDTLIDEFHAYHELEFNIGEELRYLYFYRDFSSVCVEDAQGYLNHYTVTDPSALQDFYTTRIDVFAWHEVTAEPFATADQPYQWMQKVTLDALQNVATRMGNSSNSSNSSNMTPIQTQALLNLLKRIPEDALSGPETIGESGTDWITHILTSSPNMAVNLQDGANDLGVIIRCYEEADATRLELIMLDGADNLDIAYGRKINSALKWDIQSKELLTYMQELIEYRPSIVTFVGAEYEWMDEALQVSGSGASISLRLIEGWQSEIMEYEEGCESFGIRARPAGVTDGWIYFSFWPEGYFPEEVNRSYSQYGLWDFDGYISYPITHAWHYGTGFGPFSWTYHRFPVDIGDYAIINEEADSWLLEYDNAIRDIKTFLEMEGGTQESIVLPEATIVPVDYPQSENEQQGVKYFTFETADPAKLLINSAWIYDETIQKHDDHIHLGAFWPEYVTEGRVCIEYWEGGFQPGEDVTVEETELAYYDGHYDGFTGTLPGEERFTWLWTNREHGSYVFRFENTQNWTNFQLEWAVNVIGEELDFRQF